MAQQAQLFEREQELAILHGSIGEALQQTGQLVVVQGPSGIGKTRLLAAARDEADRVGMRVLSARGSELECEFAYGLVRQLFEPLLGRATRAERAELLSGAAGQSAAVLGYADPTQTWNGDVSFARLHGLFWLTANLCAQGPLLLVLDDLQWGDAPSLRFLAHLLPRMEGLPLLVKVALRPAEPATEQHLLTQIVTDPAATVIRLKPLSAAGSADVVRAILGDAADDAFCRACHAITKGNPLLLHELSCVAVAEGVAPTMTGVTHLNVLASKAIGRRVALRLARLGPRAEALCRAVAILGDDADLTLAATIAQLPSALASAVSQELAAIEILRPGTPLGFIHPMVRTAVYEGLSAAERIQGHLQAAHLLVDAGAPSEQVAAHLLLVPPAGDEWLVMMLRQAAEEAFSRGSPEAALAYLDRSLREPPPPEQRAQILVRVGAIAQLVDLAKSIEHLRAALALVDDTAQRARIVEMLGRALHFVGRYDEAVETYAQARDALGREHVDLRRRLQAGALTVAISSPALREVFDERFREHGEDHQDAGLGGKMLDCLIAIHDTFAGVPTKDVVPRARRGLAGGALLKEANGSTAFLSGCITLAAADLDEVMSLLDVALAEAHLHGSLLSFGTLKCYRALAWFWRGHLTEAETDAREAVRAIATAQAHVFRPLTAAFLADVLMEQGRLDEAEAALVCLDIPEPTPATGHWYRVLDSRARLLMRRGKTREGLAAMLACGQCYEAHGRNPAMVAWRSGAALALLALGRREEADLLATEELALARRWGSPRALGRALRVAGLIEGGESGLWLLREAVAVLEGSPARLEHAKALVELGAALRQGGHRAAAVDHLRRGLEFAEHCGAMPLLHRARAELRASGGQPARAMLTGPAALTPTEHRVVELAKAGHSNSQIAQALYITSKTVEGHLTRAYRKLGITGRAGLGQCAQ